MEALQKRVKRQENLLQKCKEVMRTHKERSAQLSTENETLQEQLQERLQELEKIKVPNEGLMGFQSKVIKHLKSDQIHKGHFSKGSCRMINYIKCSSAEIQAHLMKSLYGSTGKCLLQL